MSKGDYAIVKSEIGGKLEKDEVRVTGAGGAVEVEWDKKAPLLYVRLVGRTGKTKQAFTFNTNVVRSIEEFRRDAD